MTEKRTLLRDPAGVTDPGFFYSLAATVLIAGGIAVTTIVTYI